MGERGRVMATAVKQDQRWKEKENKNGRPVSVPASPWTSGVKTRATIKKDGKIHSARVSILFPPEYCRVITNVVS